MSWRYYNSVRDRNFERVCLVQPEFNGYQIIGDCQFLRFSEKILNQRRIKDNGLAYLGLCVSGQKISDLLKRVEIGFYPTSKNVVLMIGTNDLLKSTPVHDMRKHMENLVCRLIENGVSTLIVLTIPPVPRLANTLDYWDRLQEFNERVKSLHNGIDVFAVDAYSEFVIKRSPRRSSVPLCFTKSPIRPWRSLRCGRDSRRSLINSWEYRSKSESRSSSSESQDSESSVIERRTVYNMTKENYNVREWLQKSFPITTIEDDHDDRFCDSDSSNQIRDVRDEINLEYFEEWIDRSACSNKDFIHLNYQGLYLIKQLIDDEIRNIRIGRRRDVSSRSYYCSWGRGLPI